MKKEKNKQVQNYRIVLGTLLVVILFLLFTMNEFKMPSLKKKKSNQESKVVSSTEEDKKISQFISSSDQVVGDIGDSGQEKEKKEEDYSLMTLEERKKILSEYSLLSNMAERENRKLKVSFVRYLEAYQVKEGSPEEFFEEWKEKYQKDKDSISSQKSKAELEREEKVKERARELIGESENMTLTQCQEMGNQYGVSLEEVLMLREGQLKIMKYALQTGRTYEYSLRDYLKQYIEKKDSTEGISVKDFNETYYKIIGID